MKQLKILSEVMWMSTYYRPGHLISSSNVHGIKQLYLVILLFIVHITGFVIHIVHIIYEVTFKMHHISLKAKNKSDAIEMGRRILSRE